MNEHDIEQEEAAENETETPVKKVKYKVLPHQKPSLGLPSHMSPAAKKRMREWASNHTSRLHWLEKL